MQTVILIVSLIIIFIVLRLSKYTKDNILVNYILCITICLPGITFGSQQILVNAIDLLIPICTLVVIFKFIKGNVISINGSKLYKIDLYLIMYLFILLISIFLSFIYGNPEWVSSILRYIRFSFIVICYFGIIFLYKNNKKNIIGTINIVVISGTISAIIGIFRFIYQYPMQSDQYILIGSNLLYRAGGVFEEANSYGNQMALILIINILLLLDDSLKKSVRAKIFLLLSSCIVLGGLIVSFSRGALIAFIIAFIIIVLKNIINFNKKIVFIIFGVLALIGTLAIINKDLLILYFNEKIVPLFSISSTNLNEISSGRLEIWSDTLGFIFSGNLNYLFFGIGYKTSLQNSNFPLLTDNTYLGTLLQTGILGFLIFILLCCSILGIFFIKYFIISRKNIIVSISFLLFIVTLIQGFTVDVFTFYRNMILVFSFIAISNKIGREENEK